MAEFQASLRNGSGVVQITVSSGCASVSIIDKSNYDVGGIEAGHARADFTVYRKVVITHQGGTKYTLSSMGDGDAAISPASAGIGTDTFTATLGSGDGVYSVQLYTIPTYQGGDQYEVGDIVISSSKFYKAKKTTTGNTPTPGGDSNWEEIVEITGFTSKYAQTEHISVVCTLNCCIEDKLHKAFCSLSDFQCDNEILCKNDNFMNAVKLLVLKKAIESSSSNELWTEAKKQFSLSFRICNCCT